MDQHTPSPLSRLVIDPGSPPEHWVQKNNPVHVNARILNLWETTIALITNERVLSQDQDRFLAMIHDHKVCT